MKNRLVDVRVHVHHATLKAWLVSLDYDRDKAVWVPKSAVQMDPEPQDVGGDCDMTLPEGLAMEKGLI